MSSLQKNLKYYIAFSCIPLCGPKRFAKLQNHFPSIEDAWHAPLSDLIQAGLDEKSALDIVDKRKSINPDQELEKVLELGIGLITIKDDIYPKQLKEIPSPPYLLYYRGTPFIPQDDLSLAVVGSRKVTPYGTRVTEDLVTKLTHADLCIVSGLALGIDGLAHIACLRASGRTIAVLGNGLDSIYPSTHTSLAREIIDSDGLIISEFPLETPSYPSNFPRRNRIISGLSLGTCVIEAGLKSGSLITAKYALEQNREVFAVPGSIYSETSVGPNQLITQGAFAVTSAETIINELNIGKTENIIKSRTLIPDTPEEAKILEILDSEPKHVDYIIRHAKLDAQKTNSILLSMELKGMIKSHGGMNYTLNN